MKTLTNTFTNSALMTTRVHGSEERLCHVEVYVKMFVNMIVKDLRKDFRKGLCNGIRTGVRTDQQQCINET